MNILVVDDEPLIAMMLADWLSEQGHVAVGPAHSEEQALRLLGSHAVDAAILDVTLGDHDCFRIAQWLKLHEIPFLFATGHTTAAIAADFKDVPRLAKPFDFEALSYTLNRLLHSRGSR